LNHPRPNRDARGPGRWARLAVYAVAGLVLGAVFTASPLTVLVVLAFPLLLRRAVKGLSSGEAEAVMFVLTAAFVARVAFIGMLFVLGIPLHNDLSVGALAGDEAYNIARSLRMRDVILSLATSKYDYMVVYDEYGRTSYLAFLTVLQVLFGPTPYGIKVLNAAFFVAGAALIYRLVRKSYGDLPALFGVAVLLFIPTLFYSSTSALKESAYFLISAACLVAAVHVVRGRSVAHKAVAIIVLIGGMWLLRDLRRAGDMMALAGLAIGVVLWWTFRTQWRLVTASALLVAGSIAVVATPQLRNAAIAGLTEAAKVHSGHVFTVGHYYQLLDDGFYYTPAAPSSSPLTLTPDHAVRFVLRGIGTFVLTPLPWQVRSRSELAVLPEQLLWYAILAGLPLGCVAGWRRDPLVTALLTGYVIPTAAVIALTSGNVGTLVRLRGLVTPYLLWVSVLGYCVLLEWIVSTRARRVPSSRSLGVVSRATR
jgi:hypothetical protein